MHTLYFFKKTGGLRAMVEMAKQLLGVPHGFKSGKHSKVGAAQPAGSKLANKAARGKLAGVGRGF